MRDARSGSLPIDEVAEGVWLGPCPSTPEFIRALKNDYGITRLVTVQTDDDLTNMGLTWEPLWMGLMTTGISPTRCPIVDFDDDALRDGLEGAVEAVAKLRGLGKVTYVHCTAGVNRSPSVVIGYLAAHGGMSLDEAWEQVTSRRSCQPNRRALEQWFARR